MPAYHSIRCMIPLMDSMCSRVAKAMTTVRLFWILYSCLHLHVFASSISLQIRSFNESSVFFAVLTSEPLLPSYVSLHGRAIGASSSMPLDCSIAPLSMNSSSVFLICSVTAFINFEVLASYDLPMPGHYRSAMILASTGSPVSVVPPPKAVLTNDSSVLLQWSPVLDLPSPSSYVIFSQRAGFPFVRNDVILGRLQQWVHGFTYHDTASFILMGCNMYSSGLLLDGLSCVNSSIVTVTVSPPPPPPKIFVRPLPNCRLLVSLSPVGDALVTEYALAFIVDGMIVFQVNTSLENYTSPDIKCGESILVEASARNLHSAGFSAATSLSAHTQAAVPPPRSLISRVSADRVTFSWLKPHPYYDLWHYFIRCFIDGVSGCPFDASCSSVNSHPLQCFYNGEISHEGELFTISHLPLGSNVTIIIQSIDGLGFHSIESVEATAVSGLRISGIDLPTITSAAFSGPDCATIKWKSGIPIIPSWSYFEMSAVAYSKTGILLASIMIPLQEVTVEEPVVRLCSLPSGVTVSLHIILNTSIGDQVSSPVFVSTPSSLPELRPALLFTRWVSWNGASLCVGFPYVSSAAVVSSYYLSCDNYFAARLDPLIQKASDVAFLFDVSNFTFHQPLGSEVNYSCYTVFWPVYIRPNYCSITVINANTSVVPQNSTTFVKWQPAANFSVSSNAKIVGVTTSCVVFDISSRGKKLQDSVMYAGSFIRHSFIFW
jgi:hypothetical protein